MKRRSLSILMASALLLALTACGGHTHTPSADWSADLTNHWHACECGEAVESAAHTLENEVCTVCGSEVCTYDDGTACVYVYNAQGDFIFSAFYAADGSVESEERVEYVYGEDGFILSQKTYLDGNPFLYDEYAMDSNGESYQVRSTYYYDYGAWDVAEYDETGSCISSYSYNPDGTVNYAYLYEYAPDGSWMNETRYEGERLVEQWEYTLVQEDEWVNQNISRYIYYGEDGSVSLYEYDEQGNETLEAFYGPDGEVESLMSYANLYNSDGDLVTKRTYENDRLAEEVEYVYGIDLDGGSWSMSGRTTTFHEDGTKTVYDSDLDATWSTETTYAADGSVLEEIRYEYLRDENGEDIGSRGYRNGKLFKEVNAMKDADGNTTSIEMIDYEEDGTKTVREYDDVFELIKEVIYAADGSVISES